MAEELNFISELFDVDAYCEETEDPLYRPTWRDYIWHSKDGRSEKIRDMDDRHLFNIVLFMEKKYQIDRTSVRHARFRQTLRTAREGYLCALWECCFRGLIMDLGTLLTIPSEDLMEEERRLNRDIPRL